MTYPPNFTYSDLNQIRSNIPMSRKPMNWEEVREASIDLDDVDDETLKSIFKLPVYNVTDLNEVFNLDGIYINITASNSIFFEDLKIQHKVFIIRFKLEDVDCGLLVDTQGYNYMRYVSLINEFGEMYDYYKKDLEIRNSN